MPVHAPPTPRNEVARLDALRALAILDTEPDPELDELTQLAAQVCGTPVALLSFVDETRQWFKSNVGFPHRETARDVSFCAHAILEQDVFEIKDATQDPRFRENALVTGGPCLRFYAGAPLETRQGLNVGTLCVIDTVPRTLTPVQRTCLQVLARNATRSLELRKTGKQLGRSLLDEQQTADSKAWLSAYVSHESRNLLTVLGGTLELLGTCELTPWQASILAAAQSSANTLQRLMEDVLQMTRSDSRELSLIEQPFDLGPSLQHLAAHYQAGSSGQPGKVRVELSADVPARLIGDAGRLEQVLHNLLGNAVKFAPKEEVVLGVTLASSAHDVHTLRFEVRDRGRGMDDETLQALFRPYRPGAEEKAGTGLGLYIARQLVEQLGGTIGADSRLGAGTTFHFVLRFPRGPTAA